MTATRTTQNHGFSVRYIGRIFQCCGLMLFHLSLERLDVRKAPENKRVTEFALSSMSGLDARKRNVNAQFANLSRPSFGMRGMLLAFIQPICSKAKLNFLQLFFETNEMTPKAQ